MSAATEMEFWRTSNISGFARISPNLDLCRIKRFGFEVQITFPLLSGGSFLSMGDSFSNIINFLIRLSC
ncbi:hypothetical protein WDU94_011154, partial [Cyamophila willieti]